MPQNFEQQLQVRRGAQSGQGRWTWAVDRGRYRSQLQAELQSVGPGRPGQPGQSGRAGPQLNWSSQGGLDPHGVSPDRFITQPSRGGARAVNFQRDSAVVSYSGPTGQADLVPGAQDRLSWLVQVLALVQAHIDRPAPPGASSSLPQRLPIWVAGPQGDAGDWWFDVWTGPRPGCWHFRRQPDRRYDVQVDLWVWAEPASDAGQNPPDTGSPAEARLARLVLGHEGGRQPPWELWDPQRATRCGLGP